VLHGKRTSRDVAHVIDLNTEIIPDYVSGSNLTNNMSRNCSLPTEVREMDHQEKSETGGI
jgi:hypothetical protein